MDENLRCLDYCFLLYRYSNETQIKNEYKLLRVQWSEIFCYDKIILIMSDILHKNIVRSRNMFRTRRSTVQGRKVSSIRRY